MANLKDWVEKEAKGQNVIGCVIGRMGSDTVPGYTDHVRGKVLTWDEAIPWLSYEFDTGYGAPIYASKDWVIFTWPTKVSRNPVDIMPHMPG